MARTSHEGNLAFFQARGGTLPRQRPQPVVQELRSGDTVLLPQAVLPAGVTVEIGERVRCVAVPGPGGRLLFVVDSDNHRVQVLNKETGAHVHTYGVSGKAGGGNHELHCPQDVALDTGPDGFVYVSDSENRRVLVFCRPRSPAGEA